MCVCACTNVVCSWTRCVTHAFNYFYRNKFCVCALLFCVSLVGSLSLLVDDYNWGTLTYLSPKYRYLLSLSPSICVCVAATHVQIHHQIFRFGMFTFGWFFGGVMMSQLNFFDLLSGLYAYIVWFICAYQISRALITLKLKTIAMRNYCLRSAYNNGAMKKGARQIYDFLHAYHQMGIGLKEIPIQYMYKKICYLWNARHSDFFLAGRFFHSDAARNRVLYQFIIPTHKSTNEWNGREKKSYLIGIVVQSKH